MNKIITIARQYGSGGTDIGRLISEKAGVPFYDRVLVEMAAEKSGISPDMLERVDEKPTNSLLYALSMSGYGKDGGYNVNSLPLNDQLFFIQCDIIRKAAAEGPCVIVGRCADYILRESSHLCRVFLYADEASRVKWTMNARNLTEKKALEHMNKRDKHRASFYNYYSGKKWGQMENYDMMLNVTGLTTEQAADIILAFANCSK